MGAIKAPAVNAGDTLTVLTTAGPRLTKVWDSGKILGYEDAKQVSVQERVVASIFDVSKLLDELEGEQNSCLIRGHFIGHAEARKKYDEIIEADRRRGKTTRAPKDGFTLRRKVLFVDRPLHYFMCDIDGYTVADGIDPVESPEAAIDQYIEAHLPSCFHGITYHWQLSSGAGHTSNAGKLKAHVWFWLDTPYLGADLESWVYGTGLHIDVSVFRPVQPNYTAAPRFINGAIDPVPRRSGLCPGWLGDCVRLTIEEGVLTKARSERKARREMVDPREKEGEIGLFCRTFEIEEVVDRWLSDVFEFSGDDEWRLNFLQSASGAAEGAGVTDNRQGIFNTHKSDPFEGRAANKWDLVRHYVFGHLDEGMDKAELHLLGPGGWPSQAAMLEMVRALPEIKAVKTSVVDAWLAKIEAANDAVDLESLAKGEIARDGALTVIDLATLETALKARFAALGTKVSVVAVRKLLARNNPNGLQDVNANGRPQETEANFRAICERHDITIRYNVINKDCEILIPGATWSIDNKANATLTMLRSLCHKEELGTRYIKEFITLLADRNQFNPVATWITSSPWDGVSRVQAFYDTVVENTEACTKETKETLMRRWAISAIAAAFSPNGVMARGVLVFQGEQYLGKTRWIESLAPRDLELIKTGKALNVHNRDSVKQILTGWISELGELDATFKRSDIAALKAFLTLDQDEIRLPYAPSESRFARRTVFAASVNEGQFLQDPTGNSRFWTIPVTAITHNHDLDMQQVWAEFYELWKSGEQHYLKHEEMLLLNDHNTEFEAVSPITELVTSHLDWANFDPNNCKWMGASDVLRWLDVKNPSKWDATEAGRAISKLNGKRRRKSGSHRFLAVPQRRVGLAGEFGTAEDTDGDTGF